MLAGLEAIRKINVPEPNPGVVGVKTAAIHTDEEAEDTISVTPLLDKRKRAPTLKSPFVNFGSADVRSTPMEGLYALNDSFADPSPEIEAKFDAWVGEGLLKHPSPSALSFSPIISSTRSFLLLFSRLYTSKSLLMASAFGDLRGTFLGVPDDEKDEWRDS
ncbi:hypothetical protein G4B88_005802 [Cannabis sativa]|uniref:Uncharacterized protein n=1 Tax=Cannabis sativa TaxID=3483 RepID=A0A7J6GSV8_CANSA|nr:hypothetical protein G4B88_005802 [Cannabis sativa]